MELLVNPLVIPVKAMVEQCLMGLYRELICWKDFQEILPGSRKFEVDTVELPSASNRAGFIGSIIELF